MSPAKRTHEIRDSIHTFIRLDSAERRVVDSPAFQRLRHIHQLALTYLIYPGATHRRFEHSLGVMELAGRVYDVVTDPTNLHPDVQKLFSPGEPAEHLYWRRVLRMAALCHDIGHLPFSHAAEHLLPAGWDHERLTVELVRSPEMQSIWTGMTPPLRTEDVVKLAVGPKGLRDTTFSDWETLLSEIIVGDAFGVDRMDYLLRDSHHAGVVYGSFDRHRLIDTLRILPTKDSAEPALGLEEGGLQSAEALMLARYFMYQQVYFHSVRRIYDIHLQEFLKDWLPQGTFPVDVAGHLAMTDAEVTAAILKAARDIDAPGHGPASHIVDRTHFKVLYQRNPSDQAARPDAATAVFGAACEKFGPASCRLDIYRQKGQSPNFPVLMRDGRIVSSLAASDTLNRIPVAAVSYVFIRRESYEDAVGWLKLNLDTIINAAKGS